MYCHTGNYNVNSDASNPGGTGWNTKIFDSLGLEYVPDWTTYKHGFRVPFAGVYRIDVLIDFTEAGWSGQHALYGYLDRNNINQSRQIATASNYVSCMYSFVNEASAGDLFTFTLLQNSGKAVVLSAGNSRFMATYLGPK